jgi:hypothetical protein
MAKKKPSGPARKKTPHTGIRSMLRSLAKAGKC